MTVQQRAITPHHAGHSKGVVSPTPEAGAGSATDQAAKTARHKAWDHDQDTRAEATLPLVDYIRHAQAQSGRGMFSLLREFYPLSRGRGNLTWTDFVKYGLYDRARFSDEDKPRFISESINWPVIDVVCDPAWRAAAEDKWLATQLLSAAGIRTPHIAAVIDRSSRAYPGVQKISTPDQLRDFLVTSDDLPLFGKPNQGMYSCGAFFVTGADKEGMDLNPHGRVSYETLVNDLTGDAPYLLQPAERNHPFLTRFTEALATVRICMLRTDDGVKFPWAALKLPARASIADNLWRSGNMICNLDPISGEILTLRSRQGIDTVDHPAHPETGIELIGEEIPFWDQVLDMAQRASAVFHPIRYQTMDIAVTPDGPALVEINYGGSFELIQIASGRGFLTDEVIEFFRACGVPRF